MMKYIQPDWKLLASTVMISALLTGCGDDGEDGQDGPDGEVAIGINSAHAIKTNVELANYDAASKTLTVEFLLTDPNGVAITGAEAPEVAKNIKFAFGRMGTKGEAFQAKSLDTGSGAIDITARADADSEIWLSYINKMKGEFAVGSGSWSPGNTTTCTDVSQCITYLGAGKYKLTAKDVINTQTFKFGYDETKPQGIFLIAKDLGTNLVDSTETYYWEPATSQEIAAPKKSMEDNSCINCHTDPSTMHHSGTYGMNANECAFCHADYNIYPGSGTNSSGATVNFTYNGSIKGLVHAAHTGAVQPQRRDVTTKFTKIANPANPTFTYKFDGKRVGEDGVTPVGPLNFPETTASCHSCHVNYNTETLTEDVSIHALDWTKDVDADGCQTCHGNYHNGNYVKDGAYAGCVACHSTEGGKGGAFRHFADSSKAPKVATSQAGLAVEATYSNLVWDGASSRLTFTMSLMKGETAVTNEFIAKNEVLVNAVNPTDPQGFTASRSSAYTTITANTDGTFAVSVDATHAGYTLPSLAERIEAGDQIAITTSVKVCFTKQTDKLLAVAADKTCSGFASPNAAKTVYLNLDGTAGTARTSAASDENCTACHTNDMAMRDASKGSYHYRNADIATCAQCHEAADYNSLIVRVHGTYGKAHGSEVARGLLNSAQCTVCHNDSYGLDDARATVVRWNKEDDHDPENIIPETFSSPQAAVCASCHVSDYYDIGGGKDSAKNHITSMGGQVDVSAIEAKAAIATEACSTCHDKTNIQNSHKIN